MEILKKKIQALADPNKIIFTEQEILEEKWLQHNLEPAYYVSNLGRFYSSKSNKILQHMLWKDGRHYISLSFNKKRTPYRIDKIILSLHNPIENMDNFFVIHKDKKPLNNKLTNLFWSETPDDGYKIVELKDLDGEIWKQIHLFPKYQISNKGRIKNNENELRSFNIRKCNKYCLELRRFVKGKSLSYTVDVDRYLMYTFMPISNGIDMIIIHKNGDPLDNNLENLEYKLRNEFKISKVNITQDISQQTTIDNIDEIDDIDKTDNVDNIQNDTNTNKDIKVEEAKEIDYSSEEWKYIENSNDTYVSSFGRVKNKYKMRKSYQQDSDYVTISITTDGITTDWLMHRLVMTVFSPIQNMENMEVNHKNGFKNDNKLANLEWCTSAQNKKHAIENGLCNIFTIPILQIDPKTDIIIQEFKSQADAARALGLASAKNINGALKGRWKTSAGYKWKYKEEQDNSPIVNLDGEIWKDVFLGAQLSNYQVSSHGRIKNKEKLLKLQKSNGYYGIELYLNGTPRHYQIHRLVGEYFLDLPGELDTVVHHKSEVKTNNHYSNLQWATHSANSLASAKIRNII